MEIKAIYGRGMSCNVFFLRGDWKVLIDSGMDEQLLRILPGLDAIINTHSHFDHTAMNRRLVEKFGCEVWMGRDEAEFFEADPQRATASQFFDVGSDMDFKIARKLEDGDSLDFGDFALDVISTPGHTVGGICLYEPETKALFSGDTVFAQGFGRYDLAGGDLEKLRASIARLGELDIATLYPAHGPILENGVNEYIRSIRV